MYLNKCGYFKIAMNVFYDILRLSILLNRSFKTKLSISKLQHPFFMEIYMLILKFTQKYKGPRIPNTTLKKKRVGDPPDFKIIKI